MPESESSFKSHQIDAMRGAAALLVFLHHLEVYSGQTVPLLGKVGGFLGVQLFFLISGYLILSSALRHAPREFLRNRFLRIVPCYWAVTLPLAVFYGKLPTTQWWPDTGLLLASLAMVSLWVPNALLHYDMVRVSWTLSIELAWYAIALGVALAFPVGREHTGRPWIWLVGITLLSSTVWIVLVKHGALDAVFAFLYREASPLDHRMREVFLLGNLPSFLAFFTVGAAMWRFQERFSQMPAWPLLLITAVVVVPAHAWMSWQGTVSPVYAIGLAAVFQLMLRATASWLVPLRWLGIISYPVYLLHVPVMLLVHYHAKLQGAAAITLSVFATLGCAALLHLSVERPFMRLARKKPLGAVIA